MAFADSRSRFSSSISVFHIPVPLPAGAAASVREQTRNPARQTIDKLHVRFDDRQNIRADNFDNDFFAILFQTRGMHGQWRQKPAAECRNRRTVSTGILPIASSICFRAHAVKRGHAILQQCQLIGNLRREKIATGREHLAEFNPYRAQLL